MTIQYKSVEVLDKGYVRLVDVLGDDLSIVNAARVSYDKESVEFTERDVKLINFLISLTSLSVNSTDSLS